MPSYPLLTRVRVLHTITQGASRVSRPRAGDDVSKPKRFEQRTYGERRLGTPALQVGFTDARSRSV